MNHDDLRLSRIDTLWSVVRQANESSAESAKLAQHQLLDRYGGAIRRYLLGSLRNEDAADEVFQEFSLKLVSGAFQKADASFGRFRSFLKTTLFHLIVDYQRRGKRNAAQALIEEAPDRAMPEEDRIAQEDAAWTRSWRDELLAKGWAALAKIEQSTGTPYYTVLRFRSENPDLRSQDIAAELQWQGREIAQLQLRPRAHPPCPRVAGRGGARARARLDRQRIAGGVRRGIDRSELVGVLPLCARQAARAVNHIIWTRHGGTES